MHYTVFWIPFLFVFPLFSATESRRLSEKWEEEKSQWRVGAGMELRTLDLGFQPLSFETEQLVLEPNIGAVWKLQVEYDGWGYGVGFARTPDLEDQSVSEYTDHQLYHIAETFAFEASYLRYKGFHLLDESGEKVRAIVSRPGIVNQRGALGYLGSFGPVGGLGQKIDFQKFAGHVQPTDQSHSHGAIFRLGFSYMKISDSIPLIDSIVKGSDRRDNATSIEGQTLEAGAGWGYLFSSPIVSTSFMGVFSAGPQFQKIGMLDSEESRWQISPLDFQIRSATKVWISHQHVLDLNLNFQSSSARLDELEVSSSQQSINLNYFYQF